MRPLPSRLVVVLAALLMLLAALSPLVAAPHEDHPGNDGDDADDDSSSRPGSGDADTEDDEDDADDDDDGRGRGPPAGIGRISFSNGSVSGDFITLTITDDGFSDFTYQGVAVFDRLTVEGLEIDDVRVRGAEVRIRGEADGADVDIKLHDTPTAVMRVDVDEGVNVTLTLADGINATQDDDRKVRLSGDGFQGILWNDDDGGLVLDGGEVSVAGDDDVDLKFMAARGPMMRDGDGDRNDSIADAASQGRVGAEVRAFVVDGTLQSQSVALTDMSVLTTRRGHNVMVVVSSDNDTGRTVVLHLDKELYPDKGEADLKVLFDGQDISRADDLADVLEPSDDDGEAEYVLVAGAEQIQVLVSVPGFSVHTVEVAAVQSILDIVPPGLSATQITLALGAAAVTVGLAATAAGKRRR